MMPRTSEMNFKMMSFVHETLAAIWPELHRLLKPGGTLSVEGRLRPPGRLFEAGQRQGRLSQPRKVG